MKKITLLIQIFVIASIAFLFSCSSSADSDPDAQIPVLSAISNDVSTVLNVAETLSVSVSVSDRGVLSYQWYSASSKLENGTAIDGATDSEFTPETNAVGIFYYYCVITNRLGSSRRSVTSPRITYAVSDSVNASAPKIAVQPVNVTADFGKEFSLSVAAYSADGGELSYQWYFARKNGGDENPESEAAEGTAIEGAMGESYKATVSAETLGSYWCVVTNMISDNGDGGEKSAQTRTSSAIVSNDTVNANPPAITAQPADVSAIIPATRIFTVGAYASDGGVLSYQWYSVTKNDAGELTEGAEIDGATDARLSVSVAETGETGYYCVVTNTIADNGDGGNKTASATTEIAWLSAVYLRDVVPSPYFTEQPVSMSVAPYNHTVTLSCKAEATGYTVSYKWYKSADGTTATGIVVEGADSDTLTTHVFTEKGIYYFYCVATTILAADEGDDVNTVATVSNVVSVAYTGLPTLYLDTDVDTSEITRDAYVQGSMKLISEAYGDFSYTFTKAKEGVKGRGNASWRAPKKGYNIKFDTKQGFFGLSAAKKWCIVSNYYDVTLLHNTFSSMLGNEIFNTDWNAHFVFVDVVMNGEYMGNYIFCEKITLTDGRIEVQDISDCTEKKILSGKYTDQNGDGVVDLYDGGFILEVDFRGDADYAFFTNKGVLFTLKDPDEVSEEIQEHVKIIVQNAEDVLYSNSFTNTLEVDGRTVSTWMQYIDIDSLIDWYIVNEFAKQLDSPFITSVYMWYSPADEKLHMGPNWDFDNSFGNWHRDPFEGEAPEGWFTRRADGHAGLMAENWIARMSEDDTFNAILKARWNEQKSALQAIVNTRLQSLANEITISAEYNFIRWNQLAQQTALQEAYQTKITELIDWCNSRYTWLDGAINGL